jgi:hypothetical protein
MSSGSKHCLSPVHPRSEEVSTKSPTKDAEFVGQIPNYQGSGLVGT